MFAQTTSAGIVPSIDWASVAPLVVMAVGGVLLITITSIMPRLRSGGFPAAFTILTSVVAAGFLTRVWNTVQTEGPSWAVSGALGIDAYTVFVWGATSLAVFFTAAFFCLLYTSPSPRDS